MNVQKADSSMQTDASALSVNSFASLTAWKKYLHDQHMAINDNQDVGVNLTAMKMGASNAKTQSIVSGGGSEMYGGSQDSIRLKLAQTKSSVNQAGYSNGKAVAVIRATAATTGRIPNHPAKSASNRLKQSKPGQSVYAASDAIYSDTEYIQQRQASSPYYHNKFSYLTSPVRLRNTSSSRMSSYNEAGERFARDYASYGQMLSPWLQRNGFPLQRNAMTEAESMESLTSNLTRRPNSVANKVNPEISAISSRLVNMPSTPTRGKSPRINGGSSGITASESVDLRRALEKDGDTYSSALSLVSNSTIFSTAEDKQTQEVRRLKRELEQANEKVATLTSQLKTNAHMVSAFEQSLSAMTARLQQLSSVAEQKDAELYRLKAIIEELQKQKRKGNANHESIVEHSTPTKKSGKDDKKSKKSLVIRRHTFASTSDESLSSGSEKETTVSKHRKKSSRKHHHAVDTIDGEPINFPTSKGWFRNSITKAFRKSKSSGSHNSSKCRGSVSDAEVLGNNLGSNYDGDSCSAPNSPVMALKMTREAKSGEDGSGCKRDESEMIEELKRQLREKEKMLIDLRLDSLTSAHQLESFKETINKMRAEMMALKQDNERLHPMVITKSLASSKSSVLSGSISPEDRTREEEREELDTECFLNRVSNNSNDPLSDMLLRLQVAAKNTDSSHDDNKKDSI
ncbi:protein sickie-like protein [Dinothrombium tinctorium]|uniref:Protein sickie-like protein n=1 Tax=Dinothrombium tinctorium TaxID=1965070 RepID=A0A3S3QSM5_9ACAR|nr:protein sickie-like protein [Dinothrombium tinctorium]RWS13372.1 protein sickie-like protein [Dinothrombium tinctorium]RWS16021.1 protein sickie-like protein [Dinothrombium tinctorium]